MRAINYRGQFKRCRDDGTAVKITEELFTTLSEHERYIVRFMMGNASIHKYGARYCTLTNKLCAKNNCPKTEMTK